MVAQSIDYVSQRVDELEAQISKVDIGKILANEGDHKATVSFGDDLHPLYHIPSVSSYWPIVGQSVRVQRSGGTLVILGATDFVQNISIQEVQPSNPYPGQQWADTVNEVLYAWDGGGWIRIGGVDAYARNSASDAKTTANNALVSSNGKNHNYYQDDPPTMPPNILVDGDLWFDTNDQNKPYIWKVVTGVGSWVAARDALINEVLDTALTAANGKNKNYYTPTEPVDSPTGTLKEGDTWFDTDDQNRIRIWHIVSGTGSWVDGRDALINANLNTALAASDGKTKVYYQSTAPTGGTYQVGDTWFNTSSGYAISRWSGSAWVAAPLGATAIADGSITTAKITASGIDAGKITTGTLNAGNVAITNLVVTNSMIVSGLDATKITVGILNAQNVAITNLVVTNSMVVSGLDAGKITVGYLSANRISSGNLDIQGGTLTIYRSSGGSSGDALYITNGRLNVNNDILSGGHIYLSNVSEIRSNSSSVVVGSQLQVTTFGVSTAAAVYRAANGVLCTASSSRNVKQDIVDMLPEHDPHGLLNLPIRSFKYKRGHLSPGDPGKGKDLLGFIAEEVADVFPIGAERNLSGEITNWSERYMIPGMLALIQRQEKRIQFLEEMLNA